tara:strand:+ start:1079 stop:1759 length:681 start_codon:yes stop_codon:yes gene_type:complete
MKKQDYKKIIEGKPWTWVKQHFDGLEKFEPSVIARCKIDPEEWLKFTVDYFDDAQQNYEMPKPHYNDFAIRLANLNVQLGRNEHNSAELNYGKSGETNKKMIEMFGEENRKLLNLRSDYLLFRLLVKMPGHGVAWHVDHVGSYTVKYKDQLDIDQKTQRCQLGQIVRLWFPITDWENGHMFQISEKILTNWSAGDVYKIPFGMGHCSANAGYLPQYGLSLTGILED